MSPMILRRFASEPTSRPSPFLHKSLFLAALLLCSLPSGAFAQDLSPTVLPTNFLRSYDPITVMFERDLGPAQGGPEDQGRSYFTIVPTHIGAYRWLDARSLEFRPASPWPAPRQIMIRFPSALKDKAGQSHRVAARSVTLLRTLISSPLRMSPEPDKAYAEEIREILLDFAQAIPKAELEQALQIAIAPLPGVQGAGDEILLDRRLWWIKTLDIENQAAKPLPLATESTFSSHRTRRGFRRFRRHRMSPENGPSTPSRFRALLLLRSPLPKASKITVRLRLALNDPQSQAGIPFWSASFRTRLPFRLQAVQCDKHKLPLAWGASQYAQDRALDCGGSSAFPTLVFSQPLAETNPGLLRQIVRISPSVAELEPHADGRQVILRGRYLRDTLYRMTIDPSSVTLSDASKQILEHRGQQTLFFYLGQKAPFLRWERGQGLIERLGPQMMPLHARRINQVDLRIHPIQQGDRRFWPFPQGALTFNEDTRPPVPGQEPPPADKSTQTDHAERIASYLRLLPSPRFSKIVTLPADPEGEGHHFGLDLSSFLRPLLPSAPAPAPTTALSTNHFLIGFRLLDGSPQRHYVFTQVTDLSLTSVEEEGSILFAVTSLQTALPVEGATVTIEGMPLDKTQGAWGSLWSGKTDGQGLVRLDLKQHGLAGTPKAIRVQQASDALILDPAEPPPVFVSNHWWPSSEGWLAWVDRTKERPAPDLYRAHLFTERPVYRPSEEVHIKGILRTLKEGRLALITAASAPSLRLAIQGPQGRQWDLPVSLNDQSSFYLRFKDPDPPVGSYRARIVWQTPTKKITLATRSFRLEEYRIPLFEVKLMAPDRAPADQPFAVSAVARYYAGGLVVEQPIRWSVVESTEAYSPPGREGFHFDSSYSFGEGQASTSRTLIDKTDKLDRRGMSSIALDPTKMLDLKPRRYRIEAEVTGTDGRTISASRSVLVLPPFSVGVRLNDRFRLQPGSVSADLIAVGIQDKLQAGIPLKVELFRREWHSQLLETDFTQGEAKYRTEVVEKSVGTCTATTQDKPVTCPIAATTSGVYLLRVQARDRMGRLQTVHVDLFVRGKERLAWERPEAGVFKISPDRKLYQADTTAKLLIRSPFQEGRAFVILEDPAGTEYRWLPIQGGQGVVEIPIHLRHAPSLPVHVLLMRGRLHAPRYGAIDPGAPQTVASSLRLAVSPRQNLVLLAMKAPSNARPKATIAVDVEMKDPDGKPLSGEIAFWVVDRAVLSLGTEGPLDPIGSFIKKQRSKVRIRDTRNQVLGLIPRRPDNFGGDGKDSGGQGMIIRRNFKSVPYYNPSILIGESGKVTVRFTLPDDVTTFAIRAVATSQAHRFGFKETHLLVNLPVMIQPTLPRFVRPGDRFRSGAIARMTQGSAGPALASIRSKDLQLASEHQRVITLDAQKAVPLFFSLAVPYVGLPAALLQMQIVRQADRESDSFEVKLPIRPDSERLSFTRDVILSSLRSSVDLAQTWPEEIRPGSGRVEILVAARGELLHAVAALESLMDYPYGCTEQRVSSAHPMLVLEQILRRYSLQRVSSKAIQNGVRSTLRHLRANQSEEGLFAFWPTGPGNLWLTAYVLPFLVDAKKAGHPVAESMINLATEALRKGLRSDYPWNLTEPQTLLSKTEILHALAYAGSNEPEYLRRLYDQRDGLPAYERSRLLLAMLKDRIYHMDAIPVLASDLWKTFTFQNEGAQSEVVKVAFASDIWHDLFLSSKIRTFAGIFEALALATPEDTRLEALKRLLLDQKASKRVGFGLREDGSHISWGSTQDNARVLFAFRSYLENASVKLPKMAFSFKSSKGRIGRPFVVGDGLPVAQVVLASDIVPALEVRAADPELSSPIFIRARYSYLPATRGSQLHALNKGFSLKRTTEVLVKGEKESRHFEVTAGSSQAIPFGAILQEGVQILNDRTRFHVAVEVPLASGLDVLNPYLKTASSEAKPSQEHSLKPIHTEYRDDRVLFFFEILPAGSHTLYFRARATTEGQFTYPPASIRMMYQMTTKARSPGYTLVIQPPTP